MTTREWLIGAALLGVLVVAMGAQAAWFTVLGPREPTIDRLTYQEAVLLVRAEESRLAMMESNWRLEPEFVRNNKQATAEFLANKAQQDARIELALWARRQAWAREQHLIPTTLRELQLKDYSPEPTR